MTRVHEHHFDGIRIVDCVCPHPEADQPWSRPAPTRIPGPGVGPREPHALVLVRPQHIMPCAILVGVASYAIAAALPWWMLPPLTIAITVLMVVVGYRVELDRMPTARAMSKSSHG